MSGSRSAQCWLVRPTIFSISDHLLDQHGAPVTEHDGEHQGPVSLNLLHPDTVNLGDTQREQRRGR